MLSSLLIALLVAVSVGVAATAYVRKVHRYRLEAAAGMRIVAGMRWREFSQLVVEALRERGFEADSQHGTVERGQQADLLLHREGQTFLLACKQGEQRRITPAAIAAFSKSVRLNGAAGGVMATPGGVDAEARRLAGSIELIDGDALWPMLKPLLPISVRDSVAAESHALSVRYVFLGWLAALAIGAGVGWLLPPGTEVQPSQGPQAPGAPVATELRPAPSDKPTENEPALATAPLTDDEQREQVRREVSSLPGIDRALWSSRSTLIVYLSDDSGTDHLRSICAVVERYDDLRASRLQLQPVPGSQRAVRFLQCRAY